MSLPESFVSEVADAVEKVRADLIAAAKKIQDEAIATGHSGVNVADKVSDALIAEIDARSAGLVEVAEAIAKAAVSPVGAVTDAVMGGDDEKAE